MSFISGGDLNIFMLCSGSLSVLLGLIICRSVVVLLKFLFLVFLFRFGFCTECMCLLVYYWRIMFVPFLLLYYCCWYVKLDIVG